MFVIQAGRGGYIQSTATYPKKWTDDLQKARVYQRRCDASNSITENRLTDCDPVAVVIALKEPTNG